nr:hypothetical protein Itr_chr03CG01960 [Ipomoea trifida]
MRCGLSNSQSGRYPCCLFIDHSICHCHCQQHSKPNSNISCPPRFRKSKIQEWRLQDSPFCPWQKTNTKTHIISLKNSKIRSITLEKTKLPPRINIKYVITLYRTNKVRAGCLRLF